MFKKLIHKVVGDPNKKLLENLRPTVDEIARLEKEFLGLPDEALRERTAALKARLAGVAAEQVEATLEEILPEAFALVRVASQRATALRHYDVQLMGGILLHQGEIVEMRTGEGKTLVATLPLFLNALTGRGVHLVTVNDYLARRDGGWMGKIYHTLGLTVGCIGPQHFSALYDPDYVDPGTELEDDRLVHWRPCTRQEAYQADITYGISSEFGFDYLRDNMVRRPQELVQRDLNYAIVDEVDNVLIDEARTPLIISGPAQRATQDYARFTEYVKGLKRNTADDEQEANGHYNLDEKSRTVILTEMGIAEIEQRIPELDAEAGDNLYDPKFFHLTYYLDNAMKAHYLFKRDHEYVVQGAEVVIVDDTTGRLMPGRRYSDGLHEAIEAKERVTVKRENVTVATITIQNYFRLYQKLGGMTGTAMTDAEEFHEVYEVDVTPLPTNVEQIVQAGHMNLVEKKRKRDAAEETYYAPADKADEPLFFRRLDYPDQIYATEEAKDQAIVDEIRRVHESGRPVLVGTTSVEHSEMIHDLLRRRQVPHAVLNAKQHQSEALIVAQAGRPGAVTISTNMAGRGTDILLGGNPESLAAQMLEESLFDREQLTLLARRLLAEGEENARAYARAKEKLSEDLVTWLVETKAEYDAALPEIQRLQVIGYLAQVLQHPYDMDYNDLLQVLRLARDNQLAAAQAQVQALGKDVALVYRALHLWHVTTRYVAIHQDETRAAPFLAELLFEQHYNARAALIRAVLGGHEEEARELCRRIPGLPPALIGRIQAIKQEVEAERRRIWALGGLHVVGSERHESRRIDNQLRGRAARQGDPGSSRFFLSLEDDLMRRFGGERLKSFMTRTRMPEDTPIESSLLDRIIESSQERIEGYNFDSRKNLLEYDDVMSKQRAAIYAERRQILQGEEFDSEARIDEAFEAALNELAENYLGDYLGYARGLVERAVSDYSVEATNTVNVAGVIYRVRGLLPGVLSLSREEVADLSPDALTERLMELAQHNLDNDTNLYQLLQAMRRFIPLLPPVPDLGKLYTARRRVGKRDVFAVPENMRQQDRENRRRDFLAQVRQLFEEFLAEHVEETRREEIWEKAAGHIDQAFARFNVERLSDRRGSEAQQVKFQEQVDTALRDLLIDSLSALDREQLSAALKEYVRRRRADWRAQIGDEEYGSFVRLLLLNAIDSEWREYLVAMDDLRREVGLEAIAQRDPKVEYKRRSYQMFTEMRDNIDRSVVDRFFVEIAGHQAFVQRQQEQIAYKEQATQAGYQVTGKGGLRREMPKVGRNDLCPCGSSRKYKNCHGRAAAARSDGNGQDGREQVEAGRKR